MNKGNKTGRFSTSFINPAGDEYDINVDFTFFPGSPAVMWGDDAHPEESPEIEIDNITDPTTGREYDNWNMFDLEKLQMDVMDHLNNSGSDERYEESAKIEEKTEFKHAEIEETDVDADELNHLARLAGIQKDLEAEDSRQVNLDGALRKKVKEESKYSTFKMLEADLAARNLAVESDVPSLDIGAEVETPNGHGIVVSMHDNGGECTYLVQHSSKDGDSDTAEYAADQVHHIGEDELTQEGNPFDPMDAGPAYSQDDPSESEISMALGYVDDAFDEFMNTDEMAKAVLADYHAGNLTGTDLHHAINDMISDAMGVAQQALTINDLDVLDDKDIHKIIHDKIINAAQTPLRHESVDLSKGSYDRLIIETILDELKAGKTIAEVATMMAFNEDDVTAIVEMASNLKKN